MPIHSVVSLSDIFYDEGAYAERKSIKHIDGGFVETCEYSGRRYVNRLFSTDPFLYLDRRYQPYTSI